MSDLDHKQNNSRRNFLKRAGTLAAYTPPAMIVLLQPSQSVFARSGGIANCNNGLGQLINDCQPKGLINKPELWNDNPMSVPGNPLNKGGS